VARQRQKLVGMCSAEKNHLHKVLVDAGIRLNVLVSDIHGSSARAMVKALIEDRPMHEIQECKGRVCAPREELFEALSTDQLSAERRFVAGEILEHIEELGRRIARLGEHLLQGLAPWQAQLNLLQTMPGVDRIGAAMLLVEITPDMSAFGSAERLASWVGICPGNNGTNVGTCRSKLGPWARRRHLCTTLALMPFESATLATEVPGWAHSARTAV